MSCHSGSTETQGVTGVERCPAKRLGHSTVPRSSRERTVWTLEAAPKQGERTEDVRTFAQRTPQWKKGAFKARNGGEVEKWPMASRRSQPSAQGLVARRKQRGPATGTDAQERPRRSQPCQDINMLARARPFACVASLAASEPAVWLTWASAHHLQSGDGVERRLLSQLAHPLCNLGQPGLILP